MTEKEFITEEDIEKALADLEMDTDFDNELEYIEKGEDNDDKKKPTNAKVEDEDSDDDEGNEDIEDGAEEEEEEKAYKAVVGKKVPMKEGYSSQLYTKAGDEGYYRKKNGGGYEKLSKDEAAEVAKGFNRPMPMKENYNTESFAAKGVTQKMPMKNNYNTESYAAKGNVKKGDAELFCFNADGLTMEEVYGEDFSKGDDVDAIFETNPALSALNDSLNAIADSQDKKSRATGTILKGMMEQIEDLAEQVAKMSGTSNGRKSITSRPVERFEKGGEGDDDKVLSISQNRNEILNVMDEITFKGESIDDEMSKAMTYFEANGVMNQATAIKIEKATGYRITQ